VGKIQRRVAAADQAGEEGEAEGDQPKDGVSVGKTEVFFGELVEERQGKLCDPDRFWTAGFTRRGFSGPGELVACPWKLLHEGVVG
jgi:hypothetical protein